MKLKALQITCIVFACFFCYSSAYALDNNVEVSIGIGVGELTVPGVSGSADANSLEFDFFYTHYFKGLETDNSPYGAREFLQHPSQIGAGFTTYDFEVADDAGDTLDYNVDTIGFAGIYYTSSEENATGVGIGYLLEDTDLTLNIAGTPFSSEGDSKATFLTLQQYLTKAVRVELNYLMEDSDTNSVSHDQTSISVGASALIDDTIWLSGYYLNGEDDWPSGYTDDDIDGLGLELGVYLAPEIGLFLSYETEKTDDGTSEMKVTDVSFTGDLYLNERTHLKGTLTHHEEDDPTFMKIEETILTAQAGLYF
jgi:hypothetical protein